MSQDTEPDDTTEVQADEYMKNDATATFDAHLFTQDDVDAAGFDADTGETDRPVTSVCGKQTSYGPFEPVDDADELDGCDRCAGVVEGTEDAGGAD